MSGGRRAGADVAELQPQAYVHIGYSERQLPFFVEEINELLDEKHGS